MLLIEFKEAFSKGHKIIMSNIPLILQCKNIDFGHVDWFHYLRSFTSFYDDEQLMMHIIDNIVDLSVQDGSIKSTYTFIHKIITYSTKQSILYYLFNNGYLHKKLFSVMHDKMLTKFDCKILNKFASLIRYLTDVSLGKFEGFYNIEKHYYMVTTMLLILKTQQQLPSAIIKHLIIPFIYQ